MAQLPRVRLLRPDGSIRSDSMEDQLGNGGSAFIVREGSYALKVPTIYSTDELSEQGKFYQECSNEDAIQNIENEKAVYNRIGKHDGIAECISTRDDGILLALYTRGNFKDYLINEAEVSLSQKVKWISSLVDTVYHFHAAKVLMMDIAFRNVMLADDLSFKMIDFGQYCLFPLEADINEVDENGYTAQADIFHLGCMIYSIVTWKRYELNSNSASGFEDPIDYAWPVLSALPPTQDILFGHIVKKCWTSSYETSTQLQQEFQECLISATPVVSKAEHFPPQNSTWDAFRGWGRLVWHVGDNARATCRKVLAFFFPAFFRHSGF